MKSICEGFKDRTFVTQRKNVTPKSEEFLDKKLIGFFLWWLNKIVKEDHPTTEVQWNEVEAWLTRIKGYSHQSTLHQDH